MQRTINLSTVPFDRISFYQRSFLPPPPLLHTVVKYRRPVDTSMGPRMFDTFFYTIPVRHTHSTEFQNMILSFVCPEHAKVYAKTLNDDDKINNDCEPRTPAIVESLRSEDLIHNGHMVSLPVVIVKNSYCTSQKEPCHEVLVVSPPAMP